MFTVTVMNLSNNKTFQRVYNDFEELRKFLIKCKYSKKVKVIEYSGVGRAGMEELAMAGV